MTAKVYDMTCSRMGITILILVLFPLIVAGSMIAIIFAFGNNMPDWLLIVVIFIILLLTAYWLIGFIKKWGVSPCTAEIDDNGIKVTLKKKSVFYPATVFQSAWADLKSASSGYEPQRDEHFYKVEFSSPPITIYLNSPEKVKGVDEETEFGSLFLAYVALQNEAKQKQGKEQIDTRNFYQSTWAKWLTYLMWLVLIGTTVGYFIAPDSLNPWKLIQFGIYSGIWLTAYYLNTRKKKKDF